METKRLAHFSVFCLACAAFALDFIGIANGDSCPTSSGLLTRLGSTSFYIVQNLTHRTDFINAYNADKECKKYGASLQLAEVDNMITLGQVGRELEKLVDQHNLRDTWYWIASAYNYDKGYYVKTANILPNVTDPVGPIQNFSAFLYRKPRPVGLGRHIYPNGRYEQNEKNHLQCLALTLPWPGKERQIREGNFYGHHTLFDERACESEEKRHVLCEQKGCTIPTEDPFVLDWNSKYFFVQNAYSTGNWIFGNRKYIVNFHHRTKEENEKYCKSLNLKLYEPSKDDRNLVPYLKMWTRELTVIQFWTGLTYDEATATYYNAKEEEVHVDDIHYSERPPRVSRRDNANSKKLCVAMLYSYEFHSQVACGDINSEKCRWSFLQYAPANCNNYHASICQHHDSNAKEIVWKPEYLQDVNLAVKETALVGFGWKDNKQTLRSTFKQTFGILYCPPGYRMLRLAPSYGTSVSPWWEIPSWVSTTEVFQYDLLETYWGVDDEYFNKNETSGCSYVTGRGVISKDNQCGEWKHYLCERILGYYVHNSNVEAGPRPKLIWDHGPQRRVFPMYKSKENQKSKGKTLITLTATMKQLSTKMAATEQGTSTEMATTEQGTSTEMATTEQGTSTEMATTEQGTSTEMVTTEQGTSTKMVTTDQGISTKMSSTDQVISTEMVATDQGTSTEMSPTEEGTSTEMSPTEEGTSTEMSPTEEGTSTEMSPTEKGTSTEMVTTEQGTSTEMSSTDQVMSTEMVATDQGTSTEISPTEEGTSTEISPTEEGTSTEMVTTEQGTSTEMSPTEEGSEMTSTDVGSSTEMPPTDEASTETSTKIEASTTPISLSDVASTTQMTPANQGSSTNTLAQDEETSTNTSVEGRGNSIETSTTGQETDVPTTDHGPSTKMPVNGHETSTETSSTDQETSTEPLYSDDESSTGASLVNHVSTLLPTSRRTSTAHSPTTQHQQPSVTTATKPSNIQVSSITPSPFYQKPLTTTSRKPLQNNNGILTTAYPNNQRSSKPPLLISDYKVQTTNILTPTNPRPENQQGSRKRPVLLSNQGSEVSSGNRGQKVKVTKIYLNLA